MLRREIEYEIILQFFRNQNDSEGDNKIWKKFD